MTIKNTTPKFIALLLVSVLVADVTMSVDEKILARMNSMTAAEYADHQRKIFHQSFSHHFLLSLVFGGLFLAGVEFIAHVIGLCFKKAAPDLPSESTEL